MLRTAIVTLALLAGQPALAQHAHKATDASQAVTKALADPARPATDRARDIARQPAALLAIAGIEPGDKVADFIMGGGYWTRILAKTVGPAGKVYAYQPAEFISFRAAYATDQDAAVKGYANVVPSRDSLGTVAFPEPLDAIVTVQNWHDLHLKQSPPGFAASLAKRLYGMLKPDGVLLVVDHVGTPSPAPFAVADSLHRGDAPATKAEIESAGFRLVAESPLYANAADPHTASAFDPSIRGKTDQFVYKFVKPRS